MSKLCFGAALCAGLIAAGFSAPAHATTMLTYDITLTQTYGTVITGSDFTAFVTRFGKELSMDPMSQATVLAKTFTDLAIKK